MPEKVVNGRWSQNIGVAKLRFHCNIVYFFSGPSKLSQVPLRRVKQQYVIATKTKIDIGDFQLPEGLTDNLFKQKAKKRKHSEDMFSEETQEVRLSMQVS